MRRLIPAAEARKSFADVLRRAEVGDLVLITRYRKPVAALLGGARLEGLQELEEGPAGGEAAAGGAAGAAAGGTAGEAAAVPDPQPAERQGLTPEEQALLEERDRAAAGSLRRIEADLARAPAEIRPALRLIRENLFHPRLTVGRIQATLGVGAHDYTTDFGRATGASIHQYFTDRRLETAARLLLDTELETEAIGLLVGYSGSEGLSRTFKTRYGVRPRVYREFGGKLSPEVAYNASADRPPPLPRYLAGTLAVPEGAACGRCGGELAAGAALRVFEDLAPICGACARRRAPELAAILDGGEAGAAPD